MKAWVVKDYKEMHMANCLIAIAHTKPEGSFDCTEVHILTDAELKEERRRAFEVGKSACMCLTCGEKDFLSGKPFEDYEKSLEGEK